MAKIEKSGVLRCKARGCISSTGESLWTLREKDVLQSDYWRDVDSIFGALEESGTQRCHHYFIPHGQCHCKSTLVRLPRGSGHPQFGLFLGPNWERRIQGIVHSRFRVLSPIHTASRYNQLHCVYLLDCIIATIVINMHTWSLRQPRA